MVFQEIEALAIIRLACSVLSTKYFEIQAQKDNSPHGSGVSNSLLKARTEFLDDLIKELQEEQLSIIIRAAGIYSSCIKMSSIHSLE